MPLDNLGISSNTFPKVRTYEGRKLLICGGARCVWDDLQRVNPRDFDIMCVNDIIMHMPFRITHAYSNDDKWLPKWVAARRPRYVKTLEESIKAHTCQCGGSGLNVWPWPGHGSSGLNAVYTGLALKYDSILLAGIPLDDSGHYFDPPWVQTNFNKEVPSNERNGRLLPRYWESAAQRVFDGKVKSLSGRTRELLG